MPFGFWTKNPNPIISPVLAMDALGFSAELDKCEDPESLAALAARLDAQFHGFRSKIPHEVAFVSQKRVIGSGEFSTLRLNDMFIVFSRRSRQDLPLRYLVAASLTYHQLLRSGFIVRGGLGLGPVLCRRDLFLGRGFLDAYRMAEGRPHPVRDVCATMVSPSFYSLVSWSERCCRLLCLYEDHFFVHPYALSDPDMGEFDEDRILKCLKDSGANERKLTATKHFLEAFEDYDDDLLPNSRLRQLTGWVPPDERTASAPKLATQLDSEFRDWPSVWRALARVRGTDYGNTDRRRTSVR